MKNFNESDEIFERRKEVILQKIKEDEYFEKLKEVILQKIKEDEYFEKLKEVILQKIEQDKMAVKAIIERLKQILPPEMVKDLELENITYWKARELLCSLGIITDDDDF